MAWFALARVLFVVAVAYAAALLQPLPVGLPANVAFALVLAALVVFFESRLRETSLTRILGALIGCGIGLAIARAVGSALFWADNLDRRVEFLQSLLELSIGVESTSLEAEFRATLRGQAQFVLWEIDQTEQRLAQDAMESARHEQLRMNAAIRTLLRQIANTVRRLQADESARPDAGIDSSD